MRGLHTEAPAHFRWVNAATVRKQKGLSEFATAGAGIRPVTFHHLQAETLHDLEQARIHLQLVAVAPARARARARALALT